MICRSQNRSALTCSRWQFLTLAASLPAPPAAETTSHNPPGPQSSSAYLRETTSQAVNGFKGKQGGEKGSWSRLMLTKRNPDVHVGKCWWPVGPGEITAVYLRGAQQGAGLGVKQRLSHIWYEVSVTYWCSVLLYPRYCEWHSGN